MIRKIRNWIKLVRYINKHRRRGIASFRVAATKTEFIIYPDSVGGFPSLRMNQQFDYADESLIQRQE